MLCANTVARFFQPLCVAEGKNWYLAKPLEIKRMSTVYNTETGGKTYILQTLFKNVYFQKKLFLNLTSLSLSW